MLLDSGSRPAALPGMTGMSSASFPRKRHALLDEPPLSASSSAPASIFMVKDEPQVSCDIPAKAGIQGAVGGAFCF